MRLLSALLLVLQLHSKDATPTDVRPKLVAKQGDAIFEMPPKMKRRLREEMTGINKTMARGNVTIVLEKLKASLGNSTSMNYWDQKVLDANTEEGRGNIRALSETRGYGKCTGTYEGFDVEVECQPKFILPGYEPLMYLAPFSVALDADPTLKVRYTTNGNEPTRDSDFVYGGDSIEISQSQTVLRAFTQANSKYDWKDSAESSAYYCILSGRHGVAYLVPYYNALPGYSGKLVTVDLDSTKFNQLRVHNIRTDFANYYSEMIRMDSYGAARIFKAGTGAYMPVTQEDINLYGFSEGSGTFVYDPDDPTTDNYGEYGMEQLITRDYSRRSSDISGLGKDVGNWDDDATLKGFQGGFTATFSRRTKKTQENVQVDYYWKDSESGLESARYDVGQCISTRNSRDELERTSNLLPWYTRTLQRYMHYEEPLTDDTPITPPPTPTPRPTEGGDYGWRDLDLREACDMSTNDDIKELKKTRTRVIEINYGFLVPFYNGNAYQGRAVRLTLSKTHRIYTETEYQRETRVCCIPSRLMYRGLKVMWERIDDGTYVKHERDYKNMADEADNFNSELLDEDYPYLREYCCLNETLQTTSVTQTYRTKDQFRNRSFADNSYVVLDLAEEMGDNLLVGFSGGFSYGEYAYYVPFFDGKNYGHRVVRVHIEKFNKNSIQVLDLWDSSRDLAGFFGGFSYKAVDGSTYGYLVPHRNAYGPVGRRNTLLTVDGFTDEPVAEGRYAYGGDHLVVKYHGKFVRMDLNSSKWEQFASVGNNNRCKRNDAGEEVNATGAQCISHPTYDVIDLSAYDPDLRGFAGGFVGGKYGYLAPYKNKIGNAGYFGKVVRINLETFEVVGVLDLTQNDPTLVGFIGAFLHGNYGILVPHRNDPTSIDRTVGDANYFKHHGQLVRFGLSNELFVEGEFGTQVGNLILTNISRMQVPDKADSMLRGFSNGFACGDYMYLVPHFNNRFHGKFTRVDRRDFDYHVREQFSCTSFLCGFSAIDSNDGTQYINLEESDSELVGFSGGFAGPGDDKAPVQLIMTGGGGAKETKYGFKYPSSNAAYNYQQELLSKIDFEDGYNVPDNAEEDTENVLGRRLSEICENLPDEYMTSTFDLCEKIFDRVTEQFESADVDVANNPIKVTSIPIQPTAAPGGDDAT